MGTLTVTSFLTLDGVVQAPGGPDEDREGGFAHGGWVVPFFHPAMGAAIDEIFARADAFLLGRRTYQIFASHWPRVTGPADAVAAALNGRPKHVATRTLEALAWAGSTAVRDAAAEVPALKARYARELQVHGSGGLVQTLLDRDLVDAIHLFVFPIVLGAGRRLFGAGTIPTAFALSGTSTTPTGIVVQSYRRAGKPSYGAFGLETQG